MKRAGLLAMLTLLTLGTAATVRAEGLHVFHFQLSASAPEADATVAAPSEVRLWFSQEPQDSTTSIRVVNGAGEALHTGDVMQDAEDPMVYSVALHGALAAGSYTVAWRALGQDGHVVRGDFAFTVAAQ